MDSFYNYFFAKTRAEILSDKIQEMKAKYQECDKLPKYERTEARKELENEYLELQARIRNYRRIERETEEDRFRKKNN